ncbi:bifunctional aspartate kinase/homoserine dehydrogenase I [Aegicerativicinus sediminis]|uniref:bifunctional aspartate kinase/homoserine dehydrogenase I n=1 Tax=Aegicerativicinus sediminis TaxID=2893202 RepID=UPI001E5982AD|nr:bifunctional aspartate kinase/homoserine dehydrogenase I [Aegicerativicinus sediminis]
MKVLKFGGTSVGSVENINRVINILSNYSKTDSVICVVSAVGGVTDNLLKVGNMAKNKYQGYALLFDTIKEQHLSILEGLIPTNNQLVKEDLINKLDELKSLLDGIYLINELSPKTSDKLVSFGELLSSFIIAEAIKSRGLNCKRKNSQDLIVTNSDFTNATVIYDQTYANIKTYFDSSNVDITIMPGFVAKSKSGEFTTLGRGGSDFTAAIIAAALKVPELEIWTDVSGMFTTNPKMVKQAFPINSLSYQEAMELSHFGAKVLYPPTVQPVMNLQIPIRIKNTMEPEADGTFIGPGKSIYTKDPVKGISNINNIALLTLQGSGMVGIPGFSKRLFETLANEKVNIILITQASSEHSICFGINEADAEKAKTAIDSEFQNEISLNRIDPIIIETDLSIVALIGDNMKNHQGISGRMFSTMGMNNINIRAIAQGASEKNISAVIAQKDVKKALNALHERFFESNIKQVNLFITGVGNVGERLVEQIKKQKKYLKENQKLNIRITGLSNSRTMYLNDDGIDLNNWKELLNSGEKASIDGFFVAVKALNLRNSVFVDITANTDVAKKYPDYLKESIAVVACNKIACSDVLESYSELKILSKKYNAPFLFETNVGAGLPIIDTLNHLITSGDKVTSIYAVLSGSLNFIFNNYTGEDKFVSVIKRAMAEGYTEPDPRIDLSGVDVARKILILARESGAEMELNDIVNESFLSDNDLKAGTVEEFLKSVDQSEAHYKQLFNSASSKGERLKYVAEYVNGEAKVGLKSIPQGHPFYNLEGKDNIVMFYTERYPEQPLIIKGAGAGAEVTASGLFADIIRVGHK